MKPKDTLPLLKTTYQEWNAHKAPRLGASLAFYTVFSIAPLLLVVIGIASLAFGHAHGRVLAEIRQVVGPHAAQSIQQMLAASDKKKAGTIASIIGVVTLLFGAAGVFGQLQDALDTIWEVQPKPGAGILGMLRQRFASFTMVLGVGFLLLVSLVISTGLAAISNSLGHMLPLPGWLFEGINFVVSLGVITALFALIFKVLPDAKIGWDDVWIGAIITAVLFTIGKSAIGLYLGHSGVSSSYGAAGSLVVLLLWVYYAAQILFFGAEFTRAYANKFGSHVVPSENAMPTTGEMQAKQGAPPDGHLNGSSNGKASKPVAHDRSKENSRQFPENRVIHGEGEPVPAGAGPAITVEGGRASIDRAKLAARSVTDFSPPRISTVDAPDNKELSALGSRRKVVPVLVGTAAGMLMGLIRRR